MRNSLVHQYKDIDSTIVFAAIPKALIQYSLYIKQITNYINSLESEVNNE
ncbi:HepT-like ribonuclease domain-containing protein [Coleofasciculus sp. E1-EBD-02]